MALRMLKAALAVVLGLASFGVLATAAPPVGADSELDLSMVSGEIRLRDAEEPVAVGMPTTFIADQDETGAITGGTFVSLGFAFERPVPGIPLTAFVDVAVSEVDPATATGSVSGDGAVTLDLELTWDVHVDFGGIVEVDCRVTPVEIGLAGVYDPSSQQVVLVDENVTIPEVPTTASCGSPFDGWVDDLLSAGSGNAIELVMEGAIDPPGDETTIDLDVSPLEAREGDEVTLTAEVAQVVAAEPLPTGVVEFRDGTDVLGTDTIDAGGVATLTTSTLPPGVRQLSARYEGDAQHSPSTSAAVETVVARAPEVTIDLGGYVVIGGSPRQAEVIVDNPADGADLDNAHVRFTLAREDLGSSALDPGQVEVEWRAPGDIWEPLPLTGPEDRVVAGTFGAVDGVSLPAGSSWSIQLRISVPELAHPATALCESTETACPGAVALTVTVDEVAPTTGTVVRSDLGEAVRHFFFVEP